MIKYQKNKILEEFVSKLRSIYPPIGGGPRNINAIKIVSAYDLTEYQRLMEKISKWRIIKYAIENYRRDLMEEGNLTRGELLNSYPNGYEKYEELNDRIIKLSDSNSQERMPQVLITFNKPIEYDIWDHYRTKLCYTILSCQCF